MWGALNALGSFATFASIFRACFAAGTPILTVDGSKLIEDIIAGDIVLSRDEFDPDGPVVPKVVEETFVRVSPVLNLRVRGRVIRTTAEHPFWVKGRTEWVPAKELVVGDVLVTRDGREVPVEAIEDSSEVVTVYNFRVADYHTYFVGCDEWGFDVWSHNASYQTLVGNGKAPKIAKRLVELQKQGVKNYWPIFEKEFGRISGKARSALRHDAIQYGYARAATKRGPKGPADGRDALQLRANAAVT